MGSPAPCGPEGATAAEHGLTVVSRNVGDFGCRTRRFQPAGTLNFGAVSSPRLIHNETIKTGSQRSTSGFWTRLRSGIIAGEVALTLVLLIGAGLLLRSVYKLSVANPGFDPAHILTVQISPNQSSCSQREACIALFDRLPRSASTVSGVHEAAVANSIPLDGGVPTIPVDVEDHPKTAEFPAPMLWLEAVSPGYLKTMHIPLLAGRYLTDNDGPASAPVVVIPGSTARRFWPAESALGKHIRVSGDNNAWRTVVGVVGDVNHFTLSPSVGGYSVGIDCGYPFNDVGLRQFCRRGNHPGRGGHLRLNVSLGQSKDV